MTSRFTAIALGLLAGFSALFFLTAYWTDILVFLAATGRANLGGALTDQWSRIAWTGGLAASAFCIAGLVVGGLGGLIETVTARIRINALRYDPDFAQTWNAADWRAAFAPTAIASRAEAMIAATLPATSELGRRVVVDTQLLVGLDQFWLDRLTLTRIIGPIPLLLAGLSISLGLLAYIDGDRWESVLAAGACAWTAIRVVDYFVRAALSASIAWAVEAMTATLRPIISLRTLASPGRFEPSRIENVPIAMPQVPSEHTNDQAHADALGTNGRTHAVAAALPDIRASIEKLLAEANDQTQRDEGQ